MKKIFFMGAILVAMSAMFSSCFNNSIENGCRCTLKYTATGESLTKNFTREEVKNADKYSCTSFAAWAEANDGVSGVDWTCWGR